MKFRKILLGLLMCVLAAGAPAGEKPKYEISKMPKALFLTDPQAQDAYLEFSPDNCPQLKPGSDGAYGYLEMITSAGYRRTGSQDMRCAVEAVRRAFARMGYETQIISYRFPYYYFSDQTWEAKEKGNGKNHDAHPVMYSANTIPAPEEEVSGMLVRPRNLGKGDLVYVKSSFFSRKSLALSAQEWQKKGAVGIVYDPVDFPFNMTGLPTAHMIHSASWHYGALPGLVVQDAGKLVGKEIEIKNLSRIYAGRGYDVVAITPGEYENYILVGGHLDSWFMGALDDGSGAASVLRIADLLKNEKPGKTGFIFTTFDGEEIGLCGSQVFFEKFGADKLKAMLNLDMVSVKNDFFYKDSARAKIMPKIIISSPNLIPAVKEVYSKLAPAKAFMQLETFAKLFGGLSTDLEWFWTAGVPGIFVYTPDKYYHTRQDTLKWMDANDLEAVSVTSAELVKKIAVLDLPRPSDSLKIDLELHRQDDGLVAFDVHLSKGDKINLPDKPVVLCYYERGYEKKVELKPAPGGGYRGAYAPLYKGEYQFVAAATIGKEPRRVIKSMVINDPLKEEPKEIQEQKGGKKK